MIVTDLEVPGTKYAPQGGVLVIARYTDGRTALLICDKITGEQRLKATINIPTFIPENSAEVVIKDYSENEGILDALVKAGVVIPTDEWISSGFTNNRVCTLTPAIQQLMKDRKEMLL